MIQAILRIGKQPRKWRRYPGSMTVAALLGEHIKQQSWNWQRRDFGEAMDAYRKAMHDELNKPNPMLELLQM